MQMRRQQRDMQMGKGDQSHGADRGRAEHNSICHGQRQQSGCKEGALSVSPVLSH